MAILILKPECATDAYYEAALVFKRMYEKVTGKDIQIAESDDGVSDIVVIGADDVNDFLMDEMFELKIGSLRIKYGTDDYCIKSYKKEERRVLVLAGGRGRSTIYAVYDYFERFLNCHYFWDGDVYGKKDSIPMEDIDIVESPRFEYRGLRYFAHRGLKRFQAEHWSYEDWKQELDWMVKKRLNFFMLRIGMDDVWQRAFPEDVSYPEAYYEVKGIDAESYNDRSDFWTLKYRGELREKVLEYARKLDLIYPTDCGTMTHWYSRTPQEFLEKRKPSFAYQNSNQYCESDTGRVWDFMQKENMDNYMKLTETMVKEYEKNTGLFHTIGLGERNMYENKDKNHATKLIAYRRIAENIRRRYPDSKLMLASWDFIGWWTPEEVQKLVEELDPERTIILDYTSEVNDPDDGFENWGIVGKFPWIFGLFHAYESESELRGPYERSDERLKIAVNDPYCKGMIFWPELSHSDPLVLEYLSENAWSPLEKNIEKITREFSYKRYGMYAERMNECWQSVLPFIKLGDWGGYSRREKGDEKFVEYCSDWYAHQDIWSKITDFLSQKYDSYEVLIDYYLYKYELTKKEIKNILKALNILANLNEALDEKFILRDCVDIIRTILGRFMNFIIIHSLKDVGNKKRIETLKNQYMKLLDVMAEVLSLNHDFSMYKTLEEIRKVAPVNPDFEKTLKRNIYNGYCSQPAFELMDVFKEEAEVAFEWLRNSDVSLAPDFSADKKRITECFINTPLEKMQPEQEIKPAYVIEKSAELIGEIVKNI